MGQRLEVEILPGKHSRPAPNGTRESFENLLENAGIKKGIFKILLGKQIRGGREAKRILIHNIDEKTNAILIKAQINGKKDQRFEFFLTLPNQFKQKPEVFLGALKKGAELVNNPTLSTIPKDAEKQPEIEKSQKTDNGKGEISQKFRHPKGDFQHIIAGEETILIFWNEIKDMFEDDGGRKKLSRKKLINNFLIQYGHEISCYRFINKLIKMGIFSETEPVRGNRKDLVVGEKLRKITAEDGKKNFNVTISLKKVEEFRSLTREKKEINTLLEEKKARIEVLKKKILNLKKEIQDLEGWITPEMKEAEEMIRVMGRLLNI